MGRKPREEYNGAMYHVIQRGNNKEYIFLDNVDKEFFIKYMLNKIKKKIWVLNFLVM
ncbi:MAG: REP-associated tyrosine transposase [Clostridiales bacterium]|jgi:REP element-mobilizing transposase RayT|nr:REP-associated tyrosine transposase [Clostridiales bacterium]